MRTRSHVKALMLVMVFAALSSCNQQSEKKEEKSKGESKKEFTPGTSLDNFKQTEFVPTLENTIADNKNSIYAPSFLYAWEKIKQQLGGEVVTSGTNSGDFKFLIQSTSYEKTLNDSDYTVDLDIEDGAIKARAYFNKTLPFQMQLQKPDAPMMFKGTRVEAFGMYYHNEVLVRYCQVLYYKNDTTFILKLIPKDVNHEIILAKGLDKVASLADALAKIKELIEKGKKERADPKQSWKYNIVHTDMFSIPEIKFKIETNYKTLEGQTFSTNGKKHFIQVAYQQTGLTLNENGAVVESYAGLVADSVGAMRVITYPKNMVFDTTFYIIVKRVDKTNPYFIMRVNNTELMIKK